MATDKTKAKALVPQKNFVPSLLLEMWYETFLDEYNKKKGGIIILLSLLVSLVVVACGSGSIDRANPARSIRPVVKIGLIAPFEGLYRRTGYEALAAMRAALADQSALMQDAQIDILPLALDDSGDPQRAVRTAQKLLADPAVGAVVGPISPWTAHAVIDTLSPSAIPWDRPFLANQTTDFWSQELLTAIHHAAHQQGAERLLIAGWAAGWPSQNDEFWSQIGGLPINFIEEIVADQTDGTSMAKQLADHVKTTDAILYLGPPADAATFISALRQKHETVPFWMGPWGDDPIFFERASRVDNVYWATWLDDAYDEWAAAHGSAKPSAYLVYKATERAIYAILNPEQRSDLEPSAMGIRLFSLQPDGISTPYRP